MTVINKIIYINIWDDFWDDGFVPEGKIQKTFAYVDLDNKVFSDDQKFNFLNSIFPLIENFKKDNNLDYTINIGRTESGRFPAILFENFTHQHLDKLMKYLSKQKVKINKYSVEFISES